MKNEETKKEFIKILSELGKNESPENDAEFSNKLNLRIDNIMENLNSTILNKAIELIESKKINLQNLEKNYDESREVELIKENKNNPHSFIKNSRDLDKYNQGLSDALDVLNSLL